MNAEQKQRAAELISSWNTHYPEYVGDRMAALLQELVDAPKLSDERILHHLDAILKASGSGLKNYSMHKTIEEMKQAFRAIEREILGGES